ncbi:hypothetical protein B4U79_17867 [Dinothrombium tinctorium]|uniref:Uncharacterized protein n=1 Tax=Dinothrombium tinctorium TaxID=1965070 RepID=A0A3S3PCG7_9ACAR|nr:hypothetical protein B4U79_17867 [Dinothrombium tinctorium]
MQKLTVLFVAICFMVILTAFVSSVSGCVPNGGSCIEGVRPYCCSGYCYRQVGWARGYCRYR